MLYKTKYNGYVEVSEPIYRFLTRNDAATRHHESHYRSKSTYVGYRKTDALPKLISYEMLVEEFGFVDQENEIFLSPEAVAEKRELYRFLHSVINRLSEKKYFIIKNIYFEGMTQAQISALLSLHKSTVSRLKREALIDLQKIFLKKW